MLDQKIYYGDVAHSHFEVSDVVFAESMPARNPFKYWLVSNLLSGMLENG